MLGPYVAVIGFEGEHELGLPEQLERERFNYSFSPILELDDGDPQKKLFGPRLARLRKECLPRDVDLNLVGDGMIEAGGFAAPYRCSEIPGVGVGQSMAGVLCGRHRRPRALRVNMATSLCYCCPRAMC